MFFVLSKILSFFFQPLSWVFVLLISCLVVKTANLKKRLFFASLIFLYVFSNPFVFNIVNDAWSIEETKLEGTYDAAIVLLGFTSLTQEPKERVHVSRAVNRVTQLIPLYRSGVVTKIIISGGSSSLKEQQKSEANEVRRLLLEWKVDERDILVEGDSRNTYENLKNNKEILGRFNKVLLVTSSYHMRRSLAIADKLGIETTPYVTDYIGIPYSSFMDYLLPSLDALQGFHSLVHEWIGYVAYSVRGYC